jgi:ribosomal-protein-alanine N-acetyltransferase
MIIGIDCSSRVGGLAIDDESYHELEYVEDIPQKLNDLGINSKDIKKILLTRGPGSFTGLRVGLAIAQGISIPHQIPILGYSTFLAMVIGAPTGNLLPILHARKNVVHVAHFEKTELETKEIFTNRIMKINELLDYIKKTNREFIILGTGADLNKEYLENNNYKIYQSKPIAPLLIKLYKNNAPYTLNPEIPFYLSPSEVYRKRESAQISLRPMKLDDIDEVIKIEKDLFPEPWDEDAFYLSIMMNDYISVVGTLNDKIISYMIGRPEGNNFHLMNIAVSRKHWQKGFGSKMISYLLKELEKNESIKSCYLEHRITNKAAFEMYKKFGFKVVGIKPNYYRNKVDAVIMEIDI